MHRTEDVVMWNLSIKGKVSEVRACSFGSICRSTFLLLVGWLLLFLGTPLPAWGQQHGYASRVAGTPQEVSMLPPHSRLEYWLKRLDQKVSPQLEDVPIREALRQLAKRGDLQLALDEELLPDKRVTLTAQEMSLLDALYAVVRGTSVQFEVSASGYLVVVPGPAIPKAVVVEEEEKVQHEVSGTVTDAETGDSLPGVNIVVKGTSIGTATDAEGHYSLSAPSAQDTLVFSFVGYSMRNVPIRGRTEMDVTLAPEVVVGQEVVVTGYQTQSRRDVTGAVSSVAVEDFVEIPANSLADQLQGQLPGVSIRTGGRPGDEARVRIRGIGTIGNNEPLYIIDGVPTTAGLNQINPNAIQSIQVLKDAASASIYGARASSGVIVITTKKGRGVSRPQIRVDYYSGIQSPTNLPEVLNTQQWADVLWAAQRNAGITPSHPQLGNGDQPVIPDYISPVGHFEGEVDESTYHPINNQIVRANKEGTDWYDVIFDPARMHSISLSATGSTESTSYFISGNYLTQNGIVKFTSFDRFSARANTQVSLGEAVSVGENLSVSFTNQKGTGGSVGGAASMLSIVPVYDIQGNLAGSRPAGLGNARNPYGDIYLGRHNRDQTFRTFGNAYLEIGAIKNVLLRSNIGIDYRTGRATTFYPLDYWNTEAPPHNSFDESTSTGLTWTWTNTLNYQTTLSDAHDLEVLMGAEIIKSENRNLFASRSSFFSTDIDYRYIGAGTQGIFNDGSGSGWGVFSLFAKADYIYDDRYLLSATVRRDGSSRFGESHRYGIFPAVSAGWRISGERFMEEVDFVSNLLLRASWGQTGNQKIGNYPFASTYGSNLNEDSYAIDGANNSVSTGFDLKVFGNPDVQWETTTQTNIGMDAGFLNGRLSLVVDLYRKHTTDMLLQIPQPATDGGATFPFVNIGSVLNRGVEVAANYADRVGALAYDLGLNVSHYTNEVTGLVGDQAFIDNEPARTQVGHPISSFYGYIIDGIFQTEEEVENHAEQQAKAVGRWIYRDLNEDGVIDSEDQTFIGNPHPDFSYGFNSSFEYKGFDLSLFIQGTIGNDIYHAAKSGRDFWYYLNNRSTRILDAWTPENRDAVLPQVNANNPNNEATKPSTYFVEDGSYLRIKSLQVGYTLPDGWLPGLDGARIYVQAKNLFTLTDYQGIDPEVGGSDLRFAVDSNHYPLAKTYTFGINLTL